MKLTYRGISYDYHPPQVEYGPLFGTGKYRGTSVGFRQAAAPAIEQSTAELNYRGISYYSGPSRQIVENQTTTSAMAQPIATSPTSISSTMTSVSQRVRALAVQHVRNIRKREQSMLARIDIAVGLTAQDAAHYESHIQGKVRHNFRATYDRSSAAMS